MSTVECAIADGVVRRRPATSVEELRSLQGDPKKWFLSGRSWILLYGSSVNLGMIGNVPIFGGIAFAVTGLPADDLAEVLSEAIEAAEELKL